MRTGRRRIALAVSAAVVAAGVVAGIALWPSSTPAPRARTGTVARPVALPAATPAPSPTQAPAIEAVAASAPSRFVMHGAGWTISAHVCGMPYVRPLDPPGEQHHTVCWVDHDFGVAPGSGTATTYILGHAWAEDDLEVLNKASEPATVQILHAVTHHGARQLDGITTYPVTALNGSTITLHTSTGTLTYTVRQVYGVAKTQAGDVSSLMNQHTPQRLVVITCAEAHGVDYDYDVIVNAFLTKAVAATSTGTA